LTPETGPPPLIYSPEPNFSGKSVFTYELDEGHAEPVRGWVSILVSEENDIPADIPSAMSLVVAP